MTDHDTFAALPARMIRFYGVLAERQIRLATEMTRMMMQPNPFLLACVGLELERPAPKRTTRTRPAPKPHASRPGPRARPKLVSDTPRPVTPEAARPTLAQAGKRARRKPSKPPAMPGTPD